MSATVTAMLDVHTLTEFYNAIVYYSFQQILCTCVQAAMALRFWGSVLLQLCLELCGCVHLAIELAYTHMLFEWSFRRTTCVLN